MTRVPGTIDLLTAATASTEVTTGTSACHRDGRQGVALHWRVTLSPPRHEAGRVT